IMEQEAYNTNSEEISATGLLESLNHGQRVAYDGIIQATDGSRKNGSLFFVYGSGGTSKSLLFKTLLAKIESKGKIALPVASSVIAAILLPWGRTAYSWFKTPIKKEPIMSFHANLSSSLAHLIKESSLIIWDETVVSSQYDFEVVDRLCKDI
ncbi:DNA helicase Pif1 like protein, partial [Chlamydoabsidia padenii]